MYLYIRIRTHPQWIVCVSCVHIINTTCLCILAKVSSCVPSRILTSLGPCLRKQEPRGDTYFLICINFAAGATCTLVIYSVCFNDRNACRNISEEQFKTEEYLILCKTSSCVSLSRKRLTSNLFPCNGFFLFPSSFFTARDDLFPIPKLFFPIDSYAYVYLINVEVNETRTSRSCRNVIKEKWWKYIIDADTRYILLGKRYSV